MVREIILSQVQSASEVFSEVFYVLFTRKKVVLHVLLKAIYTWGIHKPLGHISFSWPQTCIIFLEITMKKRKNYIL